MDKNGTLDVTDRKILELLNDGKSSIPREIAPSMTSMIGLVSNPGQVRDRMKKLIANGYVVARKKGVYQITEKGVAAIATNMNAKNESDKNDETNDETIVDEIPHDLTGIYPPLSLIPDEHYRAFVELIYAACVARQFDITPDHHSVFIIAGRPRETWKTRLGRFVCYSLGLDPDTHIAYLPGESGRSLFTRKDSSGATTFKREILNEPLVVLDEFLEADKKVRDILRLYTSANLFISYENEKMKLSPVPLITLNPIDEKKKLHDKLGLKPSELARSIVLYADNIPDLQVDEFAMHSEDIISAAKAKQIAVGSTLPKFRVNCERYRDEIIQLVRACRRATPGFNQSPTSYESIIQLCSGMTAFVDDDETAIKITLRDLFTVQETTGWVKENWKNIIDNFSLERTQRELYGEHLIFETLKERVNALESDVSSLKRDMSDLTFTNVKDVPDQLTRLVETIEYFGEVMQANCPHCQNYNGERYCMFFSSREKPDEDAIPEKSIDVDGTEHYRWYAKATFLRCGLCPKQLKF